MKKIALSLLAAAMLSGAAQASEVETVSVTVPYGDLDLTTEAGQAALDSRIDAAIDKVCAKPETVRNLKARDQWAQCRKGAEASAAEQLGSADMATETFAVLF